MEFLTPEDLPALAGYSHAVVTEPGARLVVTSGTAPTSPRPTTIAGPDPATR